MGSPSSPPRAIGRYQVFDEIASGGMATVHYGLMTGPAGFARTVAIKRLHPQFAKEPEFVAMLIDEARLAARIRHPNVVSVLDIVTTDGETLLVMDYVQGVTLGHLLREAHAGSVSVPIALAIMNGALDGLHAAHEARGESGDLLGVVHRDVSPQNILVGADGVARVADFGIAKAAGRLQTTRDGQVKGKTAYMAPEQIRGRDVDRRTDVYAASVVLWEMLAGRRLFVGDAPATVMNAVLEMPVPVLSELRADVPAELASVVASGLSRDPGARFATARDMAVALEAVVRGASARDVGSWIASVAAGSLERRARRVAEMEASSNSDGSKVAGGVVADVPVSHGELEQSTTTASLVSDSDHRKRRSGRFALVAAVAIVVLVAAAGGLQLLARRSTANVASAGPLQPPPTSASAPVGATPPPPTVAASLSAPPSALPLAPPPSAARAGSRPPPPTPRPAPINCNPPYTIDANGTRHWKNGC